jgi:hypothetical protein
MFMIEDGTGTGKKAKVNARNRVEVEGVVVNSAQDAAGDGVLFLVGADTINLTSANESAVFFVENTGDATFEIVNFTFTASAMTGATAGSMYTVRLYKNPTGITGTTSQANAANTNFGSSNSVEATILGGSEGAALTGGILAGQALFPASAFTRFEVFFYIPKGSSFGVTVQPATGNTSADVDLFFDAYLEQD